MALGLASTQVMEMAIGRSIALFVHQTGAKMTPVPGCA